MNLPQISESELIIMNIIWNQNPISTNDIIANLEKSSDWNPRTISTMLSRLEKKGAITHTKQSRVFVYYPLIEKNNYVNHETNKFIKKFYNGSFSKIVSNLIEEDMLDEKEIDELRELLNQAVKK